jgi:hypothetical protein
MTKKKIYIAGKVTGEPPHKTALKFALAKRQIEKLGHEAVNPIEVVGDWECPWDLAMRKCIVAMMACDMIFMLDDYKNSPGAKIELSLAEALGIHVLYEINDLARKQKVY